MHQECAGAGLAEKIEVGNFRPWQSLEPCIFATKQPMQKFGCRIANFADGSQCLHAVQRPRLRESGEPKITAIRALWKKLWDLEHSGVQPTWAPCTTRGAMVAHRRRASRHDFWKCYSLMLVIVVESGAPLPAVLLVLCGGAHLRGLRRVSARTLEHMGIPGLLPRAAAVCNPAPLLLRQLFSASGSVRAALIAAVCARGTGSQPIECSEGRH